MFGLAVFLLGCGDPFSGAAVDASENDSNLPDAAPASDTWSDHWSDPTADASPVDVRILDSGSDSWVDPRDAWTADEPDVYVSTPDAAADGPALCCWVAWNANGGCCPAPNDPACAHACAGETWCALGNACAGGGCAGTVQPCP